MYLKGEIMGSKFKDANSAGFKHKSDPSITAGGGIGLTFPMGFRAEIIYNNIFPVTYKASLIPKKEITADGRVFALRALYDVIDLKLFKAYVGGGVGYARIRHEWSVNGGIKTSDGVRSELSSNYTHNMAYNIMAGITGEIAPSMSLDLGYLYADYGKTKNFSKLDQGGRISMKSHNLMLGIRYEL